MRPAFKNILVLGDSIADGFYDDRGLGWLGRLEEKLHEKKPIGFGFQNFSVSGDRINDVCYRLSSYLTREKPDYLFLAVGSNDIFRYGSPQAPLSMAPELCHHYWNLTFKLARPFCKNIVVFGITPVNEALNPGGEDDFGAKLYNLNADVIKYNSMIESWCKAENIRFINFYDRFWAEGHQNLLLDDTHPNAKGHELMSQWAFSDLYDDLLA